MYIYYVFISRFGSNMDNKNSIEIEELRPELPISNYLSGNELLAFENVKDNVCYHCGKSFSEEKNLKEHIHGVIKDHVCNICKKSCSTFQNLKRHVHEGMKDYVCNHCEKSFSKSQKTY